MTKVTNQIRRNLKPQIAISTDLYDMIRKEIKDKGLKHLSVGRMISRKIAKKGLLNPAKDSKIVARLSEANKKLSKELGRVKNLFSTAIKKSSDFEERMKEAEKNAKEDRKAKNRYKDLRNRAQKALVKREGQLLKDNKDLQIRTNNLVDKVEKERDDFAKKEEAFDANQDKIQNAGFFARLEYLFTGNL